MVDKTLLITGYEATVSYSTLKIKIKSEDINNKYYYASDLTDYNFILITSQKGYISIGGLKFLSKLGIGISLRFLNGDLAYDLIPQMPKRKPDLKVRQYKAYLDDNKRNEIANKIIEEKLTRYDKLLKDIDLPEIKTRNEAIYSKIYFNKIKKLALLNGYDYRKRRGKDYRNNSKATNVINCLLNFYYGLAEHRLLMEIANTGLDYEIAFLHEKTKDKLSLTYDLIELLRYKIDKVTIKMIKNKEIKISDFKIIDNTYYRLKEENYKKYLDKLTLNNKDYRDTVKWLIDLL